MQEGKYSHLILNVNGYQFNYYNIEIWSNPDTKLLYHFTDPETELLSREPRKEIVFNLNTVLFAKQ